MVIFAGMAPATFESLCSICCSVVGCGRGFSKQQVHKGGGTEMVYSLGQKMSNLCLIFTTIFLLFTSAMSVFLFLFLSKAVLPESILDP